MGRHRDRPTVASIGCVTPPVLRRIAVCLSTGLLATGFGSLTSSAPADAAEPTPLQVAIDSLSPAEIPGRGEITVTGQVTNQSDDVWTDLNVYLLTSPGPFTTSAELAEAQQTDPATEVGGRLTAAELYDSIGDLEPGSSVDFTLSVARENLEVTGEPGVYWLGVHVLGANDDGRDSVADGRARTFVPLMERGGPQTSMSVVMPLKGGVRRDSEGRITNLPNWQELISPDGRLGRMMQLSGTSGSIPVTWVLDPAVVDAARSVAADNPALSIGPSTEGTGQRGADDGPSPTAEEPSGDSEEEPSAEKTAEPTEEAQEAEDWLNTFRRQSEQHTVLTVPYGDLDVASVLRQDFDNIFRQAEQLSTQTMKELGVDADPVVAPATGLLPKEALAVLDPATSVLLSESALPAGRGPVVETERGLRVVLADSSVELGGPAPGPPYRALALRQRILSEAAIHALSADNSQPLVVSTPQLWDPGGDWRLASFFDGLDAPWLRTVDLPTVSATALPEGKSGDAAAEVTYPATEARAELPVENLLATEELVDAGRVLANLLTENDSVDEFLAKSAMLASSYRARDHRHFSVATARGATAQVRSLLRQVRIEAPSFVTMSSKEGPFGITVVNDLDEAVTVGVNARTGLSDVAIPSPELVSLGPGQRASVRLRATSEDIGVHSVTLVPVNSEGQSLGSSTQFNIRTSQVGMVIWVIMGAAAGVLFLTSGVRIVRRVRSSRSRES